MSPQSTFFKDDEQGKITFKDYYKQKYGVKIQDMKQPLIKVIGHYEKKMVDGVL
jgi:hypothetical protein